MNGEKLTLMAALVATVLCGLVIYLERAFPFLLFSRKDPPKIIRFIERYIPPMVMSALLFYCLKDISFTSSHDYLPSLIAVSFTAIVHLLKRNFLMSVFGGTLIYMVLIKFM